MTYHAWLLGCLLFVGACTKKNESPVANPSPAESAVNKAVGSYACRTYFTSWTGGGASVTTRLRDTTIQVSRVDTNTIQTGIARLYFKSNVTWRGHSPARSNFGFADIGFGPSTTYKVLQLDAASDSIYYENSGSGHSFTRIWRYYGKKVN